MARGQAFARLLLSPILATISVMKKPALRRVLALAILAAGALVLSIALVWKKSAEEIFAEASRSVVVLQVSNFSDRKKRQGSGVVVGENEVATHCPVIKGARRVKVSQAADSDADTARWLRPQILARDNERRLCLLFVAELSQSSAAPMDNHRPTRELSAGDKVYAIGASPDSKLSATPGAVVKLLGIHGKRFAPLIQTDIAIPPSASGGGLFNDDGALAGITAFQWKGEDLNLALPIEWLPALREKGRPALAAAQKRQRCAAAPDYECVAAVALAAAESIHNTITRVSVLNDIALAQTEAGNKQTARNIFAAAVDVARNMDTALVRDMNLKKVASAQAKAGYIDDAFAVIEDIVGGLYRIRALRGIASAQAETGDGQSARRTLAKALETARGINDLSDRARALLIVASALTELGERQAARDILTDAAAAARQGVYFYASFRAKDLRDIASAQARAGDEQSAGDTFAAAAAAAQSIRSVQARARNLRDIASAQARAGHEQSAGDTFAAAAAAARNIRSARDRDRSLRRTGFARITTKKEDRGRERAAALRDAAQAQAKAGDRQSARDTFAAALAAASDIHQPSARAIALRRIAEAQIEAGEEQSARDAFAVAAVAAAQSVTDDPLPVWVARNVAYLRTRAGDIDGALIVARSVDDPRGRADIFAVIALEMAKAGGAQTAPDTFAAAVDAALADNSPDGRVQNLITIALAQTEAGDAQSARDTLSAALVAARDPALDSFERAVFFVEIASAQARAGDIDGALATVQIFDDAASDVSGIRFMDGAYTTDRVLGIIASEHTEAGRIDSALALARGIGGAAERDYSFRDIASAQAEAGDIDGALATTRDIGDPRERDTALRDIASAQAKAGDYDRASATIQSIDGVSDLNLVDLTNVVSALSQSGDFRGAMKTALEIGPRPDRVSALMSIAKHIAATEK